MSEGLPANVGLGGVEMNKKERSDWQKWWQFLGRRVREFKLRHFVVARFLLVVMLG